MEGGWMQTLSAADVPSPRWDGWRRLSWFSAIAVYLVLTLLIAQSSLGVQSLVLVAAVFGILAISLDLVAGMLGLYSLGQAGFFAIGAYFTAIAAAEYDANPFYLLPIVVIVAALAGILIGATSLRVSGLYFAITTFVFTLVLTVLATDLKITRGTQGLLGPTFPDFPEGLEFFGTPVAWCVMIALLLALLLASGIRSSPLYPVLLSIRDAEPFAQAAGVRTSAIKIGVFGLSAAMAGVAGWLFAFFGVVSPGQFDWAVSLNILVMVLVGGINTTIGPVIGAVFVTMFPAVVNINPWLQEVLYGTLSILAITVFPEGVVGLLKRRLGHRPPVRPLQTAGALDVHGHAIETAAELPGGERSHFVSGAEGAVMSHSEAADGAVVVECRGIEFGYGLGPKVLRNVDLAVRRGHIYGLIGPNGSGKSTLANIIAGRLRSHSGTTIVKGLVVDGLSASGRARLGLRRTFQAAQLVRELTAGQNVLVGLYTRVPGLIRRAAFWALLPSGRKDGAWMQSQAGAALDAVGAGDWTDRRVRDVPHGIEQLTQLASVSVAEPDIIILDEPATGLSGPEVEHLAVILTRLKARGVTMIIIEHRTRFLFPLCDQITVLNAGEVILTGTADEVRANPVVRQVYLGE
jgi:branched-chain amino acid transport system ATP-binding protein/branched-chain amino acid transport system permease protein